MEIDKVACGRRIIDLRKKKGYTQEKLAELLGISVTHINRIENGRAGVGKELLLDLAYILGVSLDYILIGVDSVAELQNNSQYIIGVNKKESAEMLSEIAAVIEKYKICKQT